MPGDGVTSPMLQREHMRESCPPHPLWAALLEDAPELTCLGNSLCSFICALLLLFRRGRFVELGSGAHLTWSWSVLSGRLVLRAPGLRDIILLCSYLCLMHRTRLLPYDLMSMAYRGVLRLPAALPGDVARSCCLCVVGGAVILWIISL